MDGEYKKISSKEGCSLELFSFSPQAQSITVRITIASGPIITRILETQITKQMIKKCQLQQFEDFEKYLLQSEDNYQIGLEEGVFMVRAEVDMMGKKKFIELLKLPLKDVEIRKGNADDWEYELSRCRSGKELPNSEVKAILLKLILAAKDQEGRNRSGNDEVIDSIITKIGVVSNKNQYLQIRFNQDVAELQAQIANNVEENSYNISSAIRKLSAEIQQKTEAQGKIWKQMFENLADRVRKQCGTIKQSYEEESRKLNQKNANQYEDFMKFVEETKQNIKRLTKRIDEIENNFKEHDSIILALKITNKQLVDTVKGFKSMGKIEAPKPVPVPVPAQVPIRALQNKLVMMQQAPQPNSALKLFTIPAQDKEKYKVTNFKIDRVGPEPQTTGLLGRIPITKQNTFKFRVLKTDAWGVSIGIKDLKNNDIIKYGGNGWISNCLNTVYGQGKGLGIGDVVKVRVDVEKDEIKWEIQNAKNNYTYNTKCTNSKISMKDRQWVAFLTISLGDSVEVIV